MGAGVCFTGFSSPDDSLVIGDCSEVISGGQFSVLVGVEEGVTLDFKWVESPVLFRLS